MSRFGGAGPMGRPELGHPIQNLPASLGQEWSKGDSGRYLPGQ
jgi:hypothetical protein